MDDSQNERRQYMRHEVYSDELYIFCCDSSKMARISNISRAGLQLEYPPIAAGEAKWKTVDILHGQRELFYLAGLPCRIIYDISHLAENAKFSGSQSRICGLSYQNLTEDQQKKLDDFLEKCDGCHRL